MGKYQEILNEAPEGATHVGLELAAWQIKNKRKINAFYKKNVSWYGFRNGEYGAIRGFFRIPYEPEDVISIDGVKILARLFG